MDKVRADRTAAKTPVKAKVARREPKVAPAKPSKALRRTLPYHPFLRGPEHKRRRRKR